MSARPPLAFLLATAVLALAGCGGSQRAIQATPSHVDLGKIAYHGKTAVIPISLRNTSRSPVTIQFLRIDGDTPATISTRDTTCPTQKNLIAGASCLAVITLRADRFGQMNGQLVVSYNRNSSPTTVPIVATGGGTPDLQVRTSQIDFGERPLGGPPARASIFLRSRGTAAAWLDTYTIEGAAANDFGFDAAHSDCRSLDAIPPGVSCRLPTTFSPSAVGSRTATAVLTAGTFVNGQPVERSFRIELTGRGRQS